MKNPRRVHGGKLAKRRGTQAEKEFDIACRYYRNQYLIDWHPTFADFVVLKKLRSGLVQGFFREKGAADRIISLAQLGGRTCWVEIKSFARQDQMTLSDKKDIHQYDMMAAAVEDGKALTFYAARWKWDRVIEWRFYSIPKLKRQERKIVFEREAGLLVPSLGGWPEWLDVILENEN